MGRVVRDGTCYQDIVYSPLPSQKRFHSSAARFKGFSGPIGSGKSQALCQEAIRLAYLNQGRQGLVGAPTYQMLRDATQKSLFEVLHGNGIPTSFNKAENILTFTDTNSSILFRSMDEFERLRGTNLAWFGVDELTYVAEEAWTRLEGRLRDPKASRLCGFAVWTPKGYDWVYKRFIVDEIAGYETILARPFENRHLLAQIPDFYERLKSSYDEQFFQQEVLGSYLNLNGGAVYRAFSRADNIRKSELDESKPLLWALDFNVDPMSSIVAQIDNGVVKVLGEIVIRRATTLDACEEFAARFPKHSAGIVIYGDASGNNTHSVGSTDYGIVDAFFRQHYPAPMKQKVPKANPRTKERVSVVNAMLRNADGGISLLVDPSCKELIQDFEQVSYKEGTTLIDKDRDPRRTHISDALGYLIYKECHSEGTVGERANSLRL